MKVTKAKTVDLGKREEPQPHLQMQGKVRRWGL